MNRFNLHNQEIKVGWGKADQQSNSGSFAQGRGGIYDGTLQPNLPDINRELPPQPAARTLWVGNVTPMVTENIIRDYFTPFGNIEMVRMWVSRHCAFVTYSNVEEATKAKSQMDRQRILDTIIRVNFGKA
jgi:RNA recognition motif-containing protein